MSMNTESGGFATVYSLPPSPLPLSLFLYTNLEGGTWAVIVAGGMRTNYTVT